jgi:ascorbate PTS system EIIA or EIIAB component
MQEHPGAEGAGTLGRLLPDTGIAIAARADDWRAAVCAAGAALVATGATTDAYTDEMIATVEALGPYIVIAPGIALAHSRPSPAVLHAGMSLVTLARPVAFGHRANDPVSLVIGLAAPDDEGHVGALATLAEFLVDEDRRRALLDATSPAAIRALITDYEAETAGAAGRS